MPRGAVLLLRCALFAIAIALGAAGCAGDGGRAAAAEEEGAGGGRVEFETLGLREIRDCADCPILVELPPGRYRMGRAEGDHPAARDPNRPEWTQRAEEPQVDVEIAYALAVGKFEVTFDEWDRCVAAGGCSYPGEDMGWGRGDRPAINLTRADAEEYVAWLSRLTGQQYRLPSEAEWEYAARAGTTTARYWGDDVGHGSAACNGCGSRWDRRSTAPAGSFAPNAFGLHEMLGNAAEWVADCWHPSHEGHPGDGSARVETSPWYRDGSCDRPVQRGGAYSYFPWTVRAAARSFFRRGVGPSGRPWSERSDAYGFRVVRTLANPTADSNL